jgi:hypothetical protein
MALPKVNGAERAKAQGQATIKMATTTLKTALGATKYHAIPLMLAISNKMSKK